MRLELRLRQVCRCSPAPNEVRKEQEEENSHLEMQLKLTIMGRDLGYHVWVATMTVAAPAME